MEQAERPASLWMMAQEYFICAGARGPAIRQHAARIPRCSGRATASCRRSASAPTSRRRSPRARSHRGRALGEPAQATRHASGLLADVLHARRVHAGRRAALGLQPVHDAGLQDDAPSAAAPRACPTLDARCTGYAVAVCKDGRCQWPAGKVWPKDLPTDDQSIYPTFLLGPEGAVLRADGVSGSGTSATVSGWACDPEWPGASVAVRIYAGGPRGRWRARCSATVRADQALATPLAREVSAACDGPGRNYARHGFSFTLPNEPGGQRVRLRDRREHRRTVQPAPPTLLRNGIVHVPRCAHSEHVSGDALSAECSVCAGSVCADESHADCCTTAWTDDCAAAADSCAPADSSVTFNSRSFAAVTTGWIEAPHYGRLHLRGVAAAEPPVHQRHHRARLVHDLGRLDERHHQSHRRSPLPPALGSPPGRAAVGHAGTGPDLAAARHGRPDVDPDVQPLRDRAGRRRPDCRRPITSTRGSGAPPSDAPMRTSTSTRTSRRPVRRRSICPRATGLRTPRSGRARSSRRSRRATTSTSSEAAPRTSTSTGPRCRSRGRRRRARPADARTTFASRDPSWTRAATAASPTICAPDHDPFCCDGGYLSYYSYLPEWDARCIAEVATYCAPSHCNAARSGAADHAAEEVGRAAPRSRRPLHDPPDLRQPDDRQDDPLALGQRAAGEAGGRAVRAASDRAVRAAPASG